MSGQQTDLITDSQIADFYRDKKILVIGGTGSIGERMIDMLLNYKPSVIRIFSRDEYKQYLLSNKYAENGKRLRYLIGDIRDYERLEMAAKNIDIIINLAALKHVPACEYNPFEAVKTNVLGTQNIINAALSCGVSRVVFTSSDKAINPTNAMGATKLLGERLMIAADNLKGAADIRFSAVRFGNVLGSRGSVIPLFVEQIIKHRKITLTDPKMTRFMMSIDSAVSLTLKSAAMAMGGEIFVLKMPNIRIMDLVDAVIELTCKKYGIDPAEINIEEIGLRSGEKMYEELMTEHETRNAYELLNMFAIVPDNYKHMSLFEGVPKARTTSYASNNTEVIDSKMVKRLLVEEKLIL